MDVLVNDHHVRSPLLARRHYLQLMREQAKCHVCKVVNFVSTRAAGGTYCCRPSRGSRAARFEPVRAKIGAQAYQRCQPRCLLRRMQTRMRSKSSVALAAASQVR
eukprot:6188860-Pleurochrysis_carterae.AAC.5